MYVRVALDIGGVISKYPDVMRDFARSLLDGGSEVFVVTDMADHEAVLSLLAHNGFDFIPTENVRCADYVSHGEGCKAEVLRELRIDMVLDDFIGYVAIDGCPVRCLVMPDASQPYYAKSWIGPDVGFGRSVYGKREDA